MKFLNYNIISILLSIISIVVAIALDKKSRNPDMKIRYIFLKKSKEIYLLFWNASKNVICGKDLKICIIASTESRIFVKESNDNLPLHIDHGKRMRIKGYSKYRLYPKFICSNVGYIIKIDCYSEEYKKIGLCGRINNKNKFSVEYYYTLYDKTKKFFSVFSRLEKPMNIAEYISIVYLYVVGVLFMFCPVRLIRIMGGILLVLATYYLILLRKSSKKPSFIKKFIKKMKKMGFEEINDINDLIHYPQMTLKEIEEIS